MHDTTAPILRFEPSRSDRHVADAARRALKAKLIRYLPESAADALLAGRPVDVEVAPEYESAVAALMPEVAHFVRGAMPATLSNAA